MSINRRELIRNGALVAGGAALVSAGIRSASAGITPHMTRWEKSYSGGTEAPPLEAGQPGRDYTPVVVPGGLKLPWKLIDGVKVYHLIAEEVLHEFMRKLRMTGAEIAASLAMASSTVSAVLRRVGLGKLSRLEPPEPPNRYERRRPGELVHIDVKKLGRIPEGRPGHRVHGNRAWQRRQTKVNAAGQRHAQTGWECVHVCIDDASRLAYVEVLPDQKGASAVGFLRRAIAFYAATGSSWSG